mgnify:CR=1 FL=1
MNHVGAALRTPAIGSSAPLARQIATRPTPGGGVRNRAVASGRSARTASTIWKKSGAAASTPTKAGLAEPSETADPYDGHIGTESAGGSQASRNAHEVPVFQQTGAA